MKLLSTLAIALSLNAQTMPAGANIPSTWRRGGAPANASGWTQLSSFTCASAGSGADCTTSTVTGCSGANLIEIAMGMSGGTHAVTDSQSNTYTHVGAADSGTTSFYYVISPTVTGSMTFSSNTGGGSYPAIAGKCWQAPTTPAFDQGPAGTTVSGTSIQPASITPSFNNELIPTLAGGNFTSTPTINDSFTTPVVVIDVPGTNYAIALSDFIQATAAAIQPTWSGLTPSGTLYASIISFKP